MYDSVWELFRSRFDVGNDTARLHALDHVESVRVSTTIHCIRMMHFLTNDTTQVPLNMLDSLAVAVVSKSIQNRTNP